MTRQDLASGSDGALSAAIADQRHAAWRPRAFEPISWHVILRASMYDATLPGSSTTIWRAKMSRLAP